MEWIDEAVVLSRRRHGETALIVHLLTRDHGRHAGLVPGGAGRRGGSLWQPGNHVSCRWRARLAEHLGTVSGEPLRAYAALLLDDPLRLAAAASAAALVDAALAEREPHPALFHALCALLAALASDAEPGDWGAAYVGWEVGLLRELGFGLDLSACAVTGRPDDLAWVSPRTGRAVSVEAGTPYGDRLLRLPTFLTAGRGTGEIADILAGLALTGHFLSRHGVARAGAGLPVARDRLVTGFQRLSTTCGG